MRDLSVVRFTPTNGGSHVVAALEGAYGDVRMVCPELPRAVTFVTGSGLTGHGLKWGHCAPDRWRDALAHNRRPEVFIGGERLATGAELTLQTLLHECAHLLAIVRGVRDTSRGVRYHNGRFVELAGELGLTYEHPHPDPGIGYSAVVLTDAARKLYGPTIARLADAITLSLDNPLDGLAGLLGGLTSPVGLPGGHGGKVRGRAPTGPNRNLMRFTCECEPPRILRMAPKVYELADVTCGECNERFA